MRDLHEPLPREGELPAERLVEDHAVPEEPVLAQGLAVVRSDEDIVGLNVTVDHTGGVDRGEAPANFACDVAAQLFGDAIEAALADALRGKRLAGAVLDVFDREPLPESSPLWDLPGVYISAHSSVSIDRYMDDVFALVYDNLKRYLAGETLHNVIELDAP